MGKIVGIDYGKRKIGVALATSSLAEPLTVLKVKSVDDAVKKTKKVIINENAEQVVIGVSSGKMAEETKRFSEKLAESTGLEIIFQDESFTTKEAQDLSIEAGIKRSKRKSMEDAFSAALILQSYLDTNDL